MKGSSEGSLHLRCLDFDDGCIGIRGICIDISPVATCGQAH